MSTLSLTSSERYPVYLGQTGAIPRTNFLFVASAVALIVTAYIVPLSVAWNSSVQINYADAENLESSFRDGAMSRRIALTSMGLFGVIAAVWPGGKVLRRQNLLGVLCAAYLLWSFASSVWSDDFGMSIRRLVALLCEFAIGLGIARRSSPRQFVWIVFYSTLTFLCLGIAAEISLGTLRPWESDYRFAGMAHPNETGIDTTMLALAAFYLAASDRKYRSLYLIAGVACVFVFLTRSRTSLASLLAALAAWRMMATPPKKLVLYGSTLSFALACVFAAVGLGALQLSTNMTALGRSENEMESLTGRIPLWTELLRKPVADKLLLGHGYGAFWTAAHVKEMSDTYGWLIPNAHSTYIDLLLSVGLIGAILCVSVLVVALLKASWLEHQHVGVGYGFIAQIVLVAMCAGVLETFLGSTCFLSLFSKCGTFYLLFYDGGTQPVYEVAQPAQTDDGALVPGSGAAV